MLLDILAFAGGFFLGFYVMAQILLPLLYGVPMAVVLVFRKRLRATAIPFQFFAPAFWVAVLVGLGFTLQLISPHFLAVLLFNKPFNLGQFVAVALLLFNFLLPRGRADMAQDFTNSTVNRFTPATHPRFVVATLEDAIERLQIGILMGLTTEYVRRLKLQPLSDSGLLANCVLRYATAVDPAGEAQKYGTTHADLVRTEALGLSALAEVAEAFSHLYAAITMLIVIRTGDPLSELSLQVGARATELSLHIPNTYEICGSGDAVACIQVIAAFAANYQRTVTQ